jgi:hypothetical protein
LGMGDFMTTQPPPGDFMTTQPPPGAIREDMLVSYKRDDKAVYVLEAGYSHCFWT